jgi:hypothetical protein
LVVGGWWLVVGGWWLVVGGWWLVGVGWWLVVGGCWLEEPRWAYGMNGRRGRIRQTWQDSFKIFHTRSRITIVSGGVGWGCALESVTVSGNGSCKDDDSAVEQTVQVRESDEDPWLVQTNKQTNKVRNTSLMKQGGRLGEGQCLHTPHCLQMGAVWRQRPPAHHLPF